MNLKRVDQADQLLSQFVKANKESALGWYFYAHLKKAKNQLEPAILGYQRTLELKPHFTQASQALAGIYEKQDKPDQALAVYQKAFVELPDVTLAHKITDALLKKDQVVEAIPYLEVIQQLDPQDLNSEVKLGLAYFEAKNYKKSETIIAKLYQKNPDSDRLQYYYGMVNEELQKTEQAIQLFSRIQPKSDFYQDAIIHVAQLYQKLKKNDEAISVMKQALLQNKNPQQAEKLSYILGNLYDQGGKTNEAIAQFTSIVEKNPDHVDALNYLGYTFTLQKKNLEQAGVYLKRAMKLKPNNPYIMDSWGWYLYQTGQLKEAHLQLKKAVQLNPEEPTLKEHLVEVSTKLSPHLLGSPEGSPESGQDRMPASTGSNP
jgi:tetratricopeptide (TPR) repeat protein